MKVLLIDVDSRMPNLALMKISAWHKKQGDQVFLNSQSWVANSPNKMVDPDKVYISCIFSRNKEKALGIAKMFNCPVEIGGYGVNDQKLQDEMEHVMPDYDLYCMDYSIGFTSRGCIRKCPWCIVPKMEGNIRDHAPIDEFLKLGHSKVVLFDNNFLASPKWRENLLKIVAWRLKVDFNQGLDIRLVDEENAKLLALCHYCDYDTEVKRLRFSFDSPQIERQVIKGIEILKKHGIPPFHLMFYVLVGYNTSYQEDLHRINFLIKEGCLPFVMPFNNRKDSYYPHLKRWINRRYYKVVPWLKYDHGNSQEIIEKVGKEGTGGVFLAEVVEPSLEPAVHPLPTQQKRGRHNE